MSWRVVAVLLLLSFVSGCGRPAQTDSSNVNTDRPGTNGDRTAYTPIFKLSGEYSGFILNRRVFDARSTYLGWVDEDGSVWHRTGRFVGEVVDENYILRNTARAAPAARAALAAPAAPAAPAALAKRAGLAQRAGWVDAWDDLLSP